MKVERSAGGLVYKKTNGQVQWLIRRPTPNPGYRGNLGWSFAKGWIDDEEKAETAAVREVQEEFGVLADIVQKLDTLKISLTDPSGEPVTKYITYYLMMYKEEAPEGFSWETAETRWVTTEESQKLLVHDNEKKPEF